MLPVYFVHDHKMYTIQTTPRVVQVFRLGTRAAISIVWPRLRTRACVVQLIF